jgi:hypothetical protein
MYKGFDWLERVKGAIKEIKLFKGIEIIYVQEPNIVEGGNNIVVELKLKKKKAIVKLAALDLYDNINLIAICTYVSSGKREIQLSVKQIIKDIKLSGNKHMYKI